MASGMAWSDWVVVLTAAGLFLRCPVTRGCLFAQPRCKRSPCGCHRDRDAVSYSKTQGPTFRKEMFPGKGRTKV